MSEPPAEISKADYEALHTFRRTLRHFFHFTTAGDRAAGLTAQQHQLLLAVKGQPNREWATISDLAESLYIRHHAAVGLVDRCERAGLVVRSQDPNDRRQVRVSLTEKGEEILAGLSARNLRELRTLRQALRPLLLEEIDREG